MFFNKNRSDQGAEKSANGVGSKKVALGKRERRLLSETIHIEEELIPPFVRPVLIVVACLVVGFLVWATLTHMKEVARAPGEIIPSGKVKVVQHLDGGIVSEIAVEERTLVEQGQRVSRGTDRGGIEWRLGTLGIQRCLA